MAEEKQKRPRGGQTKPPLERKRNNLTFRARDHLKHALETWAVHNGRSLSEEIEDRLERSLDAPELSGAARNFTALLAGSLSIAEARSGRKFGDTPEDYDHVADVVSYVLNDYRKRASSDAANAGAATGPAEPARPIATVDLRTLIEDTVEQTLARLAPKLMETHADVLAEMLADVINSRTPSES